MWQIWAVISRDDRDAVAPSCHEAEPCRMTSYRTTLGRDLRALLVRRQNLRKVSEGTNRELVRSDLDRKVLFLLAYGNMCVAVTSPERLLLDGLVTGFRQARF